MNLKNVSNQTLLSETQRLAKSERTFTANLLHHLREIDRRRLFSELRCASLHEYCTKHLKYSEDQASRRVAAARLLGEVPELSAKVASGSLNLTNINMARTLFRREQKAGRPFSATDKAAFLTKLENKSTRDAAREIVKIAPEAIKPDSARQVTEQLVELKFVTSFETLLKIQKLRGMIAHSDPNLTLGELLDRLCDSEIQKIEKTAAPRKKSASKSDSELNLDQLRRKVRARDGGKCRNCNSEHALEIDHIVPQAKGGTDTLENLRLLCRSCNQRQAIRHFGQHAMDRYINRAKAGSINSA